MTYLAWMRQFKRDDTPFGDLARDLAADRWKPRAFKTRKQLLAYLDSHHACDGAYLTAKESWSAYGLEFDTARLTH